MQNAVDRIHIGIFGPRNAGKSSLMNALTGQEVTIVSPLAGTTTDPVSKPMEVHGLGAVAFIDTAGYDDYGEIGSMRVSKTKETLRKCDIALFVLPDLMSDNKDALNEALRWYKMIQSITSDTILVINRFTTDETRIQNITSVFGTNHIDVNAMLKTNIDSLLQAIVAVKTKESEVLTIVSHLVNAEDVVMLVMPQDIQAPRGRLILPQVQTIRELLDTKCIVVCCTENNIDATLKSLNASPKIIITDSQVFKIVFDKKPKESLLTSFSVLFARIKGDINGFVEGAAAIDALTNDSKVLIAEACSHAPLAEDIGREKIPAILRKRFGNNIKIDITAGNDWPKNLSDYDLIIHCGACMFNRKHVLTRQSLAQEANVPMTNYGVFLAYVNGIIDNVVW